MALTKLTQDLNNHQSLTDQPNATEGKTPSQLKILFDKAVNDIKIFINNTLTVETDAIQTELTTHKAETVSKLVLVTEPYGQITKTTVNLGFKPKAVNIKSVILATNYISDGHVDIADTSSQYSLHEQVDNKTKLISGGRTVFLCYNGANFLSGVVVFTDTGIEITWTITGVLTGASENRRLIISAITHGGV